MDQRKLMDNASTITDMAKVSEPGRNLLRTERGERASGRASKEGSMERKIAQVLRRFLVPSLKRHGHGRANLPALMMIAPMLISYILLDQTLTHYFLPTLQTQNSVYEVLSDVNSRQDIMDERIASMEDRMNSIQCSLDVLPDILTRFVVVSSPL